MDLVVIRISEDPCCYKFVSYSINSSATGRQGVRVNGRVGVVEGVSVSVGVKDGVNVDDGV